MAIFIIMLVLFAAHLFLQQWAASHIRLPKWQRILQIELIVNTLAIATLGVIAGVLLRFSPYLQLESAFAAKAHRHEPAMLARLAEAFATYDWLLFVAIGIGGAIFLASRAEWGELTLWLGGTVGGVIFSDVLKFFLTEPRPTTADSLDLQMFWEFPSGHALGSVVCAGLIFFFITKRNPSSRERISALILLVLAVAIVSFNRMFVGSHYLGDIIAGYAAGITWLGICLMSYMGLAKPKDLGWEANTQ